jgi:hypothetical protein
MRLSDWRNNFLDWLGDKVEITSLYLDNPEKPGDTNVFMPPLRNIKNWVSDAGLRATGTQDLYITTRYSRDLAYHELPISTIEGFYSSLAHMLLLEYQGIADIIDLWFNPSEVPIEVTEHGDGSGDWLITLKYMITFQAMSELESDPEVPLVFKVNLGLYRQALDGNSSTLDWSYTTNPTVD